MGVVRASGGAYGRGRRDLGQGSWVDLRLFYPQFSADSHLLGENKVNRNPLKSSIIFLKLTFDSCLSPIFKSCEVEDIKFPRGMLFSL